MMTEQRNRSKYDIMREILDLLCSTGPRAATRVMYGAALSYAQLKSYKEELLVRGLITINSEGQWQVTQKGIEKLAILKEACA